MSELGSYFNRLLTAGMELQEKLIQEGRHSKSAEQISQDLQQELEAAKNAALRAGKRSQDVEEAAFAVVAWLDELIARYPDWLGDVTPLQKTLFNTYNAGNEFFTHLSQLTPQQDEVREVYYLVMCLGFVGQYFYESGEGGELERFKDMHSRQLPHQPTPLHILPQEHITPQPYLSPDPGPPSVPRHWDQLVLRVTLAVAVLLPLAFLAHYLLDDEEDDEKQLKGPQSPQLLQPKDPPPIPQSSFRQQQEVDKLISNLKCAQIQPLFSDNDSRVTLQGYVPRDDEATRFQQDVEKIPGIQKVTLEVQIRIWPYCEVVEILQQDQHRNHKKQYGLSIKTMKGHSESLRFIEGEKLSVSLTGPTYNAYLYVDYYQRDEMVVHLLPNPDDRKNGWKAGDRPRRVPPENNSGPYKIQEPFGEEMVVVMASSAPLFAEQRPELEAAEDYLTALQQALKVNQDREHVTAEYLFIQTEPLK